METQTLHLDGLNQENLLILFVEWYDFLIRFPGDKVAKQNMAEIRARLEIRTSAGMEPEKGAGI